MVYEAIAASASLMYIEAYVATAFLSALAFLYLSRVWDDVPLKFFLIHFFIVAWSGVMYLNFLAPEATRLSNIAWYADWVVSTPLILLALGLTATYKTKDQRWDLLGALMGAQILLVITGIISQESGATYAYWVGNALLLGVIYLLWGPLREIAEDAGEALAGKYKLLAGYISVFFLLYPTVWYLGAPGPLDVLDANQTSIAFVILPFFCKQVYGFLDLYMLHQAEQA